MATPFTASAAGASCLIGALENPRLNDAMLGLHWQSDRLAIRPDVFPCCRGTGEVVGDGFTFRCDAHGRVTRAQDLVALFHRTWPQADPVAYFSPAGSRDHAILAEVADMVKGNAPQALMTRGRKGEPSPLWMRAMAATWRFGFTPHIFHFPTQARRALETLHGMGRGIPLIMVEQVGRLWDPQKAYECEALISFAYKANACLWMEFLHEAETGAGREGESARRGRGETFAQQAFARRLDALAKSRSPLSYLEPDSVGRLKFMTENPRLADEAGGGEESPFDA